MQTPLAYLWAILAEDLSAEVIAEKKRRYLAHQVQYQHWCAYRRAQESAHWYEREGRTGVFLDKWRRTIVQYEQEHGHDDDGGGGG